MRYISRNSKKRCFQCHGIGKVNNRVCPACKGYGSVTLAKLEAARKQTNEGRDPGFVDLDRAYEDSCADICGR